MGELEVESLGQRIKRLRKERGLSQIDLARSCGVTDPWISQVEQDKVTASPSLLSKVAEILKVTIRELLQEDEQQMEVISRIKLAEVLLETNQSEEAERIILSLIDHPHLSEHDSIKLSILLSESKYQQKKYSECIDILKPLIHALESSNFHDAHLLAEIRNQIGKSFFQMLDFTSAFYNYQKSYEYTLRFDSFDFLAAKISYNLAVALRNIKRSMEAQYYLEMSHQFFQKNNDLTKLCQTFYEQGINYKEMKDYSRATEAFDNSKSIMQALNLKSMAIIVQHTLAYEITSLENPDLSLEQLSDCAKQFYESGDVLRTILVYSEIATINLRLEKTEESFTSLNSAFPIIETLESDCYPEIAFFYRVLATYHFNCQNYDQSVDYAYKSYEIFAKMGLVQDQIESLLIVVDSYQAVGQYEKALFHERQRCVLYSKM